MEKGSWDDRLYKSIALQRSFYFRPIAIVLSKLGVTPNIVSYLGVLLMVAFIFEISRSLSGAAYLLAGQLICDQIDGAIARYKHTDSDRGKFIDVLADTTVFALFLTGLVRIGLVHATTGAIFMYVILLVRALGIIRKNLNHKSDWLFFAGAGPLTSTLTFTFYGLFFLHVISGFAHLQAAAELFAGIAILGCLGEYVYISRRV